MSTLAAAEATLDNSCIRELLFENIKLLVRDLNAAHVNISSSCCLKIFTAVCCTGFQHGSRRSQRWQQQQLLFENINSCLLLYRIPTRWNFNAGSRSSCSLKILIAVCCLQDSNMAAGDLNAGSCSICSLKILTAVCCTGFQHGRWRSQRWQQQLGSTGAATAEKRLPCCYGPLQPSAPPHPTTTAQTCCDHW